MKIDEHILKFPKSLPNDEQQFMTYYPYKFPKVIEYYEQKSKELCDKPEEYAQFVQKEFLELRDAVNKVNELFQNGDKTDLKFLIEIDQKFNKIFCFKFWIINYVFADGPIHEFYVDQLRAFARKIVDVTDDIEEYEQKIIRFQRDLLQTDYADIYLAQALHGVQLIKYLDGDAQSKEILDKVIPLIDKHDEHDAEQIREMWKPVVERILDDSDEYFKPLKQVNLDSWDILGQPPLLVPVNQVRMRKNEFPLYSFLNHVVEFRNQNEVLEERFKNMKATIEEIFVEAKSRLSEEGYSDFKLSYEMAKNFSKSKDLMGNVDPILIPVWERDVHARIYEILSKEHTVRYPSVNHASVFGSFIWYLPDDLKSKVMSVDDTFFDADELSTHK
ncbi:hypothetical protein IPJ70_04170 [Candidatus Campbellbacteria bacterium]|nr:MAG: hypothetical protein IPJ70_04170 [Candidatus Campbellbacteria bacterium]